MLDKHITYSILYQFIPIHHYIRNIEIREKRKFESLIVALPLINAYTVNYDIPKKYLTNGFKKKQSSHISYDFYTTIELAMQL